MNIWGRFCIFDGEIIEIIGPVKMFKIASFNERLKMGSGQRRALRNSDVRVLYLKDQIIEFKFVFFFFVKLRLAALDKIKQNIS